MQLAQSSGEIDLVLYSYKVVLDVFPAVIMKCCIPSILVVQMRVYGAIIPGAMYVTGRP